MALFLDTNILLRHLTQDDPVQSKASTALLRHVEQGEEVVITSELVVAEAVFILQSKRYGLSPEAIRDALEPLIFLPRIHLAHKPLYRRAFELYCAERMSFVDAYNTAFMEARGITEIYSYDTDFDKVRGVKRVEPEA